MSVDLNKTAAVSTPGSPAYLLLLVPERGVGRGPAKLRGRWVTLEENFHLLESDLQATKFMKFFGLRAEVVNPVWRQFGECPGLGDRPRPRLKLFGFPRLRAERPDGRRNGRKQEKYHLHLHLYYDLRGEFI
jgi:hypothetical protein